ncbi:hypothetical protein GGS20DRAFT_139806 [Poronia punctata]|nr:hypothetical protein GGS20DRAFT_139806 [Poronia punctata]
MGDPLLTSLCTICHIQQPKYKCPRCGARTCSLACVKKHKTWSSCNGERDATAFVQLGKLKTDAGIDHDYNFLTKIERSVERAERILRDDRDILPQEKPNPPPHKKTRFGKGQSRGRTLVDEGPRRLERNVIQRMRDLGIHVSSLPYGMIRAKENNTSWNRRTRTINWQIEWLFFDSASAPVTNKDQQPTRMLYKALDETPLHVAFDEASEYYRQRRLSDNERAEEKKAHRKLQALAKMPQGPSTSTWHDLPCVMQDYTSSAWNVPATNRYEAARAKNQFFLLRPRHQAGAPQRLIPLDASQDLATILPHREIIEFPTIYVFSAGMDSPEIGFIIEEASPSSSSKKRKASALVGYEEPGSEADNTGILNAENPSDDETSSSGSDSDTGSE